MHHHCKEYAFWPSAPLPMLSYSIPSPCSVATPPPRAELWHLQSPLQAVLCGVQVRPSGTRCTACAPSEHTTIAGPQRSSSGQTQVVHHGQLMHGWHHGQLMHGWYHGGITASSCMGGITVSLHARAHTPLPWYSMHACILLCPGIFVWLGQYKRMLGVSVGRPEATIVRPP